MMLKRTNLEIFFFVEMSEENNPIFKCYQNEMKCQIFRYWRINPFFDFRENKFDCEILRLLQHYSIVGFWLWKITPFWIFQKKNWNIRFLTPFLFFESEFEYRIWTPFLYFEKSNWSVEIYPHFLFLEILIWMWDFV